jgi:hypothetical protein
MYIFLGRSILAILDKWPNNALSATHVYHMLLDYVNNLFSVQTLQIAVFWVKFEILMTTSVGMLEYCNV